MITLYHCDNSDVELPANAAIISDPPYGCNNDCDYTRFSGGLRPSRNYHKGIVGDDTPFDPTRWLSFQYVALFGYQFFADKLPVGTVLVWNKKRESQLGTFLSDCELAWVNRGKGCYLFNHVWHGFDRQTERGKSLHPSQKPAAVMSFLIEKAKVPPEIPIVDPYMGSGSTMIAAHEMGYDAIGIDLEQAYFDIVRKRLDEKNIEYEIG